ncbi:hypothetical protein CEXT_435161, partial [Caerostris extrusa]
LTPIQRNTAFTLDMVVSSYDHFFNHSHIPDDLRLLMSFHRNNVPDLRFRSDEGLAKL